MVLIREAGGMAGDIDGKPDVLETGNILAANTTLHPLLQKSLKRRA